MPCSRALGTGSQRLQTPSHACTTQTCPGASLTWESVCDESALAHLHLIN